MQMLVEHLSDSLCIVDENGIIRYTNSRLKQELGWECGDCIEKWMVGSNGMSEWIQGDKQEIRDKDGVCCKAKVYKEQVIWQGIKGYYVLLKYEALKDKQSRLMQTWFNGIDAKISIRNRNGKFIYCNESYAKLWGLTQNDVMGKYIEEVIPSGYYEKYKIRDEEIYRSGQRTTRIECLNENGKEQKYDLICQPIWGESGEIEAIGYMGYNVTAKRKIEEKARGAFKQFIQVVEPEIGGQIQSISEFLKEELEDILQEYTCADSLDIWIYNPDEGQLTSAFKTKDNQWMLSGQTGIKITNNWIEKYMEEEVEPVKKIDEDLIEESIKIILKQQGYRYAVQYPIKCGGQFFGVVSMLFKQYPGKQVIRNTSIEDMCDYIGYIIRRHTLLQKLQKEFQTRIAIERQLEAYLEASTDILAKVDKQGNYLEVNEEATKILGWQTEEFLNQKWIEYAHPEDLAFIEAENKGIDQGVKKAEIINRYLHKDGSYRWMQWRWKPFEEGEIGYITARDITERKLLEEKKLKLEKVLQLNELRKEFFANISHELRTPLAVMIATQQLIASQIEERHYKKLNQNANRLLRLVNNLIDMTKIDAGHYQIEQGNYNIIQLVEDLTLSLVDYAGQKEIEVIFDTESEEEVVACDPYSIERVMLNLLSNAIKYNHKGGKIKVILTLEPNCVVVSVKDNGVGIPEEQLPFIFERFVRVNNLMTHKCEGSGIGLSLVKSIIEMHKGEVGVKHENGETCFWFKLPRVVDQTIEPQVLNEIWIEHQNERFKVELADIY